MERSEVLSSIQYLPVQQYAGGDPFEENGVKPLSNGRSQLKGCLSHLTCVHSNGWEPANPQGTVSLCGQFALDLGEPVRDDLDVIGEEGVNGFVEGRFVWSFEHQKPAVRRKVV